MMLVLAGFVSGIVSGMGIGGGALLIPALVFLANTPQHAAQCTNLIYFIPTAMVALVVHIKNKCIDFRTAAPVIAFGLAGAFAGTKLAISLEGGTLRKLFGIFLLAIGIYELLRKSSPKNSGKQGTPQKQNNPQK